MSLFGLVVGILFGFTLQKGGVVKYDSQVGAMQLKDMSMFRFMMTTMLVGMFGLGLASAFDLISFTHEPLSLFGVVVGGLIFGIGWSILGYCPGTAGGALGEGYLDALSGIAGLLVGGVVYAFIYPNMTELYNETIIGTPGLPELLGLPVLITAGLMGLIFITTFFWWSRLKI